MAGLTLTLTPTRALTPNPKPNQVNMAGQTHPGGRRQACIANTHTNPNP